MAGFFLKPSNRGHHARSISLPARSHPTTLKIEEELNKIHNLELCSSNSSSSSSSLKANKLCMAISSLVDLYKCIGDHLLNLPQTQQVLTKHHDSSWVNNELLEESLSFLDVCGSTRENISLLKESIGKLQSSLRRRINSGEKGIIEGDVSDYVFSLKNLKREMAKSLTCLKHIDTKFATSSSPIWDNDEHLFAVVRVLRETSLTSNVVFRAILGYFSNPSLQSKPNKWSLVLKLMNNKGRGDDLNELEDVEVSLNSLMVSKLSKEGTKMRLENVCKKLNELETRIEGLEKEIECLFKQLIQTRVSLLNILSHH